MKSIKTLLILCSAVLLLSANCNKNRINKNRIPGVVKGRLMLDCATPFANKMVKMRSDIGGGASFVEDANGNKEFYTDANGYFTITYVTKGWEGTLNTGTNIMTGIPLGEGKNLDIGEVNIGGTVNFVIKLDVNNPYTASDTLIIPNYNSNDPYGQIKIGGPFSNSTLDTITGRYYTGYPINYSKIPKSNINYYFTIDGETKFLNFETPFCSSTLSEAIITIN